MVREFTALVLAWLVVRLGGFLLNAGLTWALERTGSWPDRVRRNRLDPLRELQRFVEAALSLGLAGAVAARTGWPEWLLAGVFLLWPLHAVREVRTAAALAHLGGPGDMLALHERGFLADTHGPLPTRAVVVLLAVVLYASLAPMRAGCDWLAGLAAGAAWRLASP